MRISESCSRNATMRAAGWMVAVVLAAWVLISVPKGARAGKTGPCSALDSCENLTTIIHDTDTAGAQLLLRSDDYNGSGEATYSAALDPNVSSDLYNGQWFLDLYSQSARTIYITPNDAINSSQPAGPPPGYYWQDVEVSARCFDQNLNLVQLQNILTSSGNCLRIVDFYSGGIKYKLAMGPSLLQTLQQQPNTAPATGLVTATCNSTNIVSGVTVCVNWTLTPNTGTGASNPPTVADLFYYAKGGKLIFIGQYHDTFRIDFTNP
jgi:hypothetical protein